MQRKISGRVIDVPDIALRKGAEIEVFLQFKYFVMYIFCLKSPAGQGSTKSRDYPIQEYINCALLNLKCVFISIFYHFEYCYWSLSRNLLSYKN